jgi:AraC-like DNA-binding protein
MLFSAVDFTPWAGQAMGASWHSEIIPERDQFASWRDACCRHVYAVTPERASRGPFRGRIEARRFGGIDLVTLSCEGHRVSRSAEDIARAATDTYYLYRQGAGNAWFRQRNVELVAETGDMVVADPNIPFVTGSAADFDFRIWRIARRSLDPLLAAAGDVPMTMLARRDGIGALTSSYLWTLTQNLDRIDPRAEAGVVQNLVRLVALAMGTTPDQREAGRDAVRQAKYQQALQYIDRHLSEPDLAPARIAVAIGVSLRKLHLLFEPKAMSVARWIQHRRLQEIHALLTGAAGDERSITDLAFAWGFNDLSTFYRAFRAAYGAHPGEVRAAAQRSK